jgi:hypothetical protein
MRQLAGVDAGEEDSTPSSLTAVFRFQRAHSGKRYSKVYHLLTITWRLAMLE